MAIRFKLDEVPVECDSAAEAAEVIFAYSSRAKCASASINGDGKPAESHADKPAKGDFAGFWKTIDDSGRKLLQTVASSHGGVTAEALVSVLSAKDVNAVAWVRRRMNGQAESNGIKLDKLLTLGKTDVNGKPKTSYRATPRLNEYLKQLPA